MLRSSVDKPILYNPVAPGLPGVADNAVTYNRFTSSAMGAEELKRWVELNVPILQGFRLNLVQGLNPVTLQLSSPGALLLGVSYSSQSQLGSDVRDVNIRLSVNNDVIIENAQVGQFLAGDQQPGKLYPYVPTIFPLNGNDKLQLVVNRQTGGSTPNYIHVWYIPQR